MLFLDAEDPNLDITLYINNAGGSVTAAAVYDAMNQLRSDVPYVGTAASMGAFLLSSELRVKDLRCQMLGLRSVNRQEVLKGKPVILR